MMSERKEAQKGHLSAKDWEERVILSDPRVGNDWEMIEADQRALNR